MAGGTLIVLGIAAALIGWFKKRHWRVIVVPSIAVILGMGAYMTSDFMALKLYPLILSLLFLSYFIVSVVKHEYLLIGWIEKFKKRPLLAQEREDIILSHWFWIGVLLLNSSIHLILVMRDDLTLWALYSFVGWYALFALAIVLQIFYVHRFELSQWGRNGWGYGLFAGVIIIGFIPAVSAYAYQRFRGNPKAHVVFQRITAAMFHVFFRFAPNISFVRVDKSDEIEESGNYIYVASHESWLDYPLMGAYITDLYHLTNKKKAFTWIIRPVATLLGVIDGAGGNPLHQLLLKLRSHSNVLIFPEGSRSLDGEIGVFKKGAFSLSIESSIEVVPVVISGTRLLVSKGSLNWKEVKKVDVTIDMLSPMRALKGENAHDFSERVRLEMMRTRKNRSG